MNQLIRIMVLEKHNYQKKWLGADRYYWCLLCLLMFVLIIYYQVRNYEFINYDDHAYVTNNYYILKGISRESLRWVLLGDVVSNWHPLTMLTHMLDVSLYGVNAGAHHLTNVQFHIINTILMFLVFSRMTKDFWKPAFIAVIFAVHPLHAESVAWISERKDVLSACFWLLTMWSYLLYIDKPCRLRYWLTILCFSLGLLAKPMLVTLPFVLLLIDYWPLRRFEKGRAEKVTVICEKLPFLAITISFSIITFFIQKLTGAVSTLAAIPYFVRAANAAVSYVIYIYQTFWPSKLAIFYPYPKEFGFFSYTGSAAIILLISGITWLLRKSFPYIFVGWFWFLGTLIPVIGFVQVGMQAHADRYMYLPMTGLLILVVYGAGDFLKYYMVSKCYAAALMIAIMVSVSYLGHQQVSRWQNSYTLFEQAIQNTQDNSLAYFSAATYLYNIGQYERAKEYLERARQISPGDPHIYMTLYSIAQNEKNEEKANYYYKKIMELNPSKGFLQGRLGTIELERKDYPRAEQYFRKAVSFNTADAVSLSYLGIAVCEQDRLYEGLYYLRHSEELNPQNSLVQHNLGVAYKKLGQLENAIIHFGNALSLDPANTKYLERFRGVLQERKALRKKATELEARVADDPKDAEGFFELAMINGVLQNPEKELQYVEASVQVKPDFQKGLAQLGICYAERARYKDALATFEHLASMEPKEAQWDFRIATVKARMNDAQGACAALRSALEKGYLNEAKTWNNPNFDPVRDHPCFQEMLKRYSLDTSNSSTGESISK